MDPDLVTAIRQHNAGQLHEAENLYRQILARQPEQPVAWHMLGVLAYQVGRLEVAAELVTRSLALDPECAEAQNNLGNILQRLGRHGEAIATLGEALRLKPGNPIAYYNLGNSLQGNGQPEEAIAAYRTALQGKPQDGDIWNNLGNSLQSLGRYDEAIAAYREVLRLGPNSAAAYSNLSNIFRLQGRLDEAIAACREALRLEPDFADAWNNLSVALVEAGDYDEAIAACSQAIRLNPRIRETHNNLGNALRMADRLDEAIAAYREALGLEPNFPEAQNNLGNVLKDCGRLPEAVAAYREALRLMPGYVNAHSNLLLSLCYLPDCSAARMLEECREWNRRHAQPLVPYRRKLLPELDPERRLRIGYVSADFREHVVGSSLLPVLRARDRAAFEVFCYSDVLRPDAYTAAFAEACDGWLSVAGLDDRQVAERIRADRIDILVDFALHTNRNRLLVFAQKPAPVQVSYLGYCGTTGLETMDYRLSDRYLDPVGSDLGVYSEETIRLADSYWCYEPLGPVPEVSPLPAVANGYVTFGCLNNFAKGSAQAQNLWVHILRSLPESRLLLGVPAGRTREELKARFGAMGVEPQRLEFVGRQPWPEYIETWQRADIALDPFPFCGGITTCDALWMGVPAVSLSGATAVGRGGVSILGHMNLLELVAETRERYADIAVSFARDLPRLAALRSTLRPRMQESPLRDPVRFSRNLEAAFREMWRSWCCKPSVS